MIAAHQEKAVDAESSIAGSNVYTTLQLVLRYDWERPPGNTNNACPPTVHPTDIRFLHLLMVFGQARGSDANSIDRLTTALRSRHAQWGGHKLGKVSDALL